VKEKCSKLHYPQVIPSVVDNREVQVGIVGLGQLVREVHLPILRQLQSTRVVAIADPYPAAVQQCLPMAEEARAYSSLDALLEDDCVEAVLVASPSGEHAWQAQRVLAAGKALYLEKPIGSTAEEGRAVALAAARAAAPATMGFNYRFHPLIQRARHSLQQGKFGRVKSVRSCFSISPRPLPAWKQKRSSGGGVLLDLASHHFDLLRHLLGAEVTAVSARIWDERSEADCCEAELVFENGVQAQCSFSFCGQERDSLELIGANGRMAIDRYAPLRYPISPLPEFVSYQLERRRSPWKEVSYRRSLQAWTEAIRGRRQPAVTLNDGLHALRIVLAAEQSALHNRPIRLDDVEAPVLSPV
jgi:myo-inositol 2-dehydrogenase / D-chiro-inositol 1-dehydrogenase